jgi:hypothetical protein
MLEKYTFMSKILFTQNFIYALWFKWFQAIYFFVFQNLSMCHTYIYILLALRQNPLNINFLGSFENCRGNFHRTCPASRTITRNIDMSRPRVGHVQLAGLLPGHIRLAGHVRLWARTCICFRFLAYIRGLSAPLKTLVLFSLPRHHLRQPMAL